MKIYQYDVCNMTKMVAMSIYGKKKPFTNLLPLNQLTDSDKTLYVAPGTQAHHSLFK